MNDKWFNIAMIIVFTSIIANGLVFMLTAFPNGAQTSTLYNSNMDYSAINHDYNAITGESILASSETGFNPITTITGDPFGLSPLNLLASAFVGLEAMLLTLADVFPMFSFLFVVFAIISFIVKAVVIAYFASVLVRSIFGGRA